MTTEEETQHEDDDLVSDEQIIEAVRARLENDNLETGAPNVKLYDPINVIGPGIWVSERHAGTWFLDGYSEDGTPRIDIDDVSMAPAGEEWQWLTQA